jgi:hypothetical protein
MTIQELCDRLSQFPPDTPVVVRGYEGGFNDVLNVEAVEMQLNVNAEHWYYGAHSKPDILSEVIADVPLTKVAYLHSDNHLAEQ